MDLLEEEETAFAEIVDLAASGRPDDTLEAIKAHSDSSLYFFTKAVLGYNKLTPRLHQDTCQWLTGTREMGGRGILMPRGSYKSTIVKSYVLWRLKDNLDLRVLFIGESDTVAAKSLNDIRWHLTQNKLLAWLYPHMIPADTAATRWTQTEILLPRARSFDEPTITTAGVGAKLTGFHYDIIVYDDIIGLVAAQSPAEMNSAIEWFRTAPGLLNDPSTAEEIIAGTRWKDGVADLYGWAMDRIPYRKTAGIRDGFVWYVRKAIEDDKPIFPEKYSLRVLESIRRREGEYHFAAQYMNDPTAPESVDFPPSWVKTWRPKDGSPNIAILEDCGEEVRIDHLVKISFYDPSAGGKMASAENAVVITGMDRKRRILVLDNWSRNCGFGEALEQWHVLNDKWAPWKNYYEAVGPHKEVTEIEKMRPPICLYCHKAHTKRLNPKEHRPSGGSGSKEDRIRALAQQAFEEGRVYLKLGMEKLRRQIVTFPNGAMVDIFDALAYAISLGRAPSIREETDDDELTPDARPVPRSRGFTSHDYGGYL